MKLADKTCVACTGGMAKLTSDEWRLLLPQLNGWHVEGKMLTQTFKYPDFVQSLAMANKIGQLAEAEGHHPDLHIAWGMLKVDIWTHKVDGLTESDFVLAAKIDRLRKGA